MRQHEASFANFICRFGSEKVLLDYAMEIVLPAFTDDTLVRGYGSTHYFFYNSDIVILNKDADEPTVAVTGRFIKNTQLSREQIFDDTRGLLQDEAVMSSAPSAFFVLILNNHRLIYFPETAHAPTIENFKSTCERFLKQKHGKYIDTIYNKLAQKGKKETKKKLREINPSPSLEVIPISGDEEIEDFVRRYQKLKKIEFKIIRPNDEIDGGEIFNEIRDFLGPIEPTDTKLVTSRADGLDIEQAIPRIKIATETDNQEVKLSGTDLSGNQLRGDNNEFKISAPIDPLPPTTTGLVEKLIATFSTLKSDGTIKTGKRDASVKDKILSIIRML